MNKEIKKCLDYLVANEWLLGYQLLNNYIVLRYSLSSVKSTELSIEYNKDITLRAFLERITKRIENLENDIKGVLTSKNDYYGYNSMEELNQRIEEEKYFLKSMIYDFKKKNNVLESMEELMQLMKDIDFVIDKHFQVHNFKVANYIKESE